MSVTNPEPGAITPAHIAKVREVRAYLARAEQMKFSAAPSVRMLAELLECYDTLGARLAWLAALHAEATTDA